MERYDWYKSKLTKLSAYDNETNISDFWFEKGFNDAANIFFNNGEPDLFAQVVRWESELGKVCTAQVKKYLLDKHNERYHKPSSGFAYTKIDFLDFKFEYQGKEYNLETFADCFRTSRIYGWHDLRGIDLSGIRLDSCEFINCMFAGANFRDNNLQQLNLVNTNFVTTDFSNARFVNIRMDKDSTIGGADFTNAFVNALDLNDKILGDYPIKYNEVSYCSLVIWSIINLYKPVKDTGDRKHTVFQANTVKDITYPGLIQLTNYIKWYQKIYSTVHRYTPTPFSSRLQFFFEILFTKYWRSFTVLGMTSLVINFLFALLYYGFAEDFNFDKNFGFFDCIYYSVVTFTTLGYGDIHPITSLGQVLVILEVLLGYVILGLFVFLLSKKIEIKF